jgi:hypothetical protein
MAVTFGQAKVVQTEDYSERIRLYVVSERIDDAWHEVGMRREVVHA